MKRYYFYFLGVVLATILAYVAVIDLQIQTQTTEATPYTRTVEETRLMALTKLIQTESKLSYEKAVAYSSYVMHASYKYKVDDILILAIIKTESNFNETASTGTGTGLMQIVQSVHKRYKNLTHPFHNIDAGTSIFALYRTLSKNDSEALLRYNGTLGVSSDYSSKVLKIRAKYDLFLKKELDAATEI